MRQVTIGETVYRAVMWESDHPTQVLVGKIVSLENGTEAGPLMRIKWEASPDGPGIHTSQPWLETLFVHDIGKRVFFDRGALFTSLLARVTSMTVRLKAEISRLEEEAILLRKALDAFSDKDTRRWQCPWCDQWSVMETKAPSGLTMADGMYACTECQFKGNGAEMLRNGCGGYLRTVEASDETQTIR